MKPVLQEAILAALNNIGPMTVIELAAHTGRTEGVTREALLRLRTKGMVRIGSWVRVHEFKGGRHAAMWTIGAGEDAVAPPADSSKKRNARYRQRHAATLKAKMTARRRAQGVSPMPSNNLWKGLVRAN